MLALACRRTDRSAHGWQSGPTDKKEPKTSVGRTVAHLDVAHLDVAHLNVAYLNAFNLRTLLA
jgi:hypothetical protein